MAKKKAATVAGTFEMVKPYLERAMTDEEFRKDLKDALAAARELYGPLSKQNGVSGGARALATDKKAQDQMRRAMDDLLSAKDNLQGKKKKATRAATWSSSPGWSPGRSTTRGRDRRRGRSCST